MKTQTNDFPLYTDDSTARHVARGRIACAAGRQARRPRADGTTSAEQFPARRINSAARGGRGRAESWRTVDWLGEPMPGRYVGVEDAATSSKA